MTMSVITEYYIKPDRADQVAALLRQNWPLLHQEGLTTDQPAFLMVHPDDDEIFLEAFEWKDETGPDRAWQISRIKALWDEIQSHCEHEIEPEYYNALPGVY